MGCRERAGLGEADEPAGRRSHAIRGIAGIQPESRGRVKPCMHPRIHTCRQSMQAMGLATGRVEELLVVLALVFPCR